MPSRVPRITGREVVAAFAKVGYEVHRIKGSHHILKHPTKPRRLSVPVHKSKTVPPPLLRSLIRAAELTVDEFCQLL